MMADQNTQETRRAPRWRLDGWSIGAALIAGVVLAPMLAVVWIAFHPTENIWPHLLATVLPRYFATTVTMMLGVGVLIIVFLYRFKLVARWFGPYVQNELYRILTWAFPALFITAALAVLAIAAV